MPHDLATLIANAEQRRAQITQAQLELEQERQAVERAMRARHQTLRDALIALDGKLEAYRELQRELEHGQA